MNRADVGRPPNRPTPANSPPGVPAPGLVAVRQVLGAGDLSPSSERAPESYGQALGSSGPVMRKTTVGALFSTTLAFGPAIQAAWGG